MAVPTTIADLSTTASSNSPAGSDTATTGAGPDDYLRAHAAIIKTHTEATAEHGATGAVVGTTNTQTLTNKTLTAPVINGTVTTTGLTLPAATVGVLNGTTIPTSKTLMVTTDIDTTTTLGTSDVLVPSQNAVKTYADTKNIATQVTPSTSGNVLTSNGSAWTSAALPASSPFTESYSSTAQTITLGGLLTLAHGLSSAPTLVRLMLECTTGDAGYSIGDKVEINPNMTHYNSGGGQSIYSDTTNIYVRYSSGAYQIHNKANGTAATLTTASWKLLVFAWA